MDFLKLKMAIRMSWKIFFVFILVIPVICGCSAEKKHAAVNTKQAAIEAGNDGEDKNTKTEVIKNERKTDESQLYKNVPVYSKNQKKKIKKYLSSLPDKITEKEAKKKGIVIETYDADKNDFNTMWQGFYKYVREGEEALKTKDGVIKCYAEPFKAAIVLLRYTTEGDACYIYISFIEGEYYVITDSSRDKFGAYKGDGIDEIGTFKSLRKRKEATRCGRLNYYVTYSVFKKQGISKKEIKKIIKKSGSYVSKYYDLFGYYI